MLRIRTDLSGLSGGQWLSTHNFLDEVGNAAACHAAVVTFWNSVRDRMAITVVGTVSGEVDVFDETTGQTTSTLSIPPVGFVGSRAGELAPMATQGLIRLRTSVFVAGRRIQGKLFIPGVCEIDCVGGRPDGAYADDLEASAQALADDVNTQYAVWSRTKGTAAPVTAASTWSEFAVLRSRRD